MRPAPHPIRQRADGASVADRRAAQPPAHEPYRPPPRLLLALAVSIALKLLIPALGLWPKHLVLSVLLFTGPDLWMFGGILIPNATWLFPVVRQFTPTGRQVWLTIDDGPEPATTPRILDLLDQCDAKATFFVIGEKARGHPELIREIERRGHTLGNHTDTHPVAMFWLAGPRRTRREYEHCQAELEKQAVTPVTYFRAPAGIQSFFLHRILAENGSVLVGWSARGREQTATTIEVPLRRLKRRIRPGAILLTHESSRHPAMRLALLEALLMHLSETGYHCVLPSPEQLLDPVS